MINNINKLIGSNIRCVRIKNKTTQTQLGIMINISLRQICKYEQGICNISVKRLYEISQALNISIVDVIPDKLKKI